MSKNKIFQFMMASVITLLMILTACDEDASIADDSLLGLMAYAGTTPHWKVITPPEGMIGVPVYMNVVLLHNGNLDRTVDSNDYFYLIYQSGNYHEYLNFNNENSYITIVGNTVTIDPNAFLPANTVFTSFQISSFEDEGQADLETYYFGEYHFTTGEASVPK